MKRTKNMFTKGRKSDKCSKKIEGMKSDRRDVWIFVALGVVQAFLSVSACVSAVCFVVVFCLLFCLSLSR